MQTMEKSQRVRVVRSFLVGLEVQERGSVIALPYPMAIAMRGANKVEFVDESTPLGKPGSKPSPIKSALAEKGA